MDSDTAAFLTSDRRKFLTATSTAFAGLMASGCTSDPARGAAAQGTMAATASTQPHAADPYGPLIKDPAGMLDLPKGFSYRVLSSLGEAMDDGGTVPDRADGMGCIDLGKGKLALVRNHEIHPGLTGGGSGKDGALTSGYASDADGVFYPGGTTNLILDAETLTVEAQFRSLGGTIRNCSGGVTPWGTWLTCEEPGGKAMASMPDHGWVFEVPAGPRTAVDAHPGKAQPIKAMGRFNHEAACVDPATGIVYMSEDTEDSMLYRYIPDVPGKLAAGGRLQALALVNGFTDARNWEAEQMALGVLYTARWIDLPKPESPTNDLRLRAAAEGGLKIARGEGIHLGTNAGAAEIYLCSTNGGAAKLGQIFKLVIGVAGAPDQFGLFLESTDPVQFNFGDNLTVQDNGHLIVCEDGYSGEINHLRGVMPDGSVYPFARLTMDTEPAGACFSPDGQTMFLNVYSPTRTLAITGPWAKA